MTTYHVFKRKGRWVVQKEDYAAGWVSSPVLIGTWGKRREALLTARVLAGHSARVSVETV